MVTGKEKDNISKMSLKSNVGEKIMPEGSDINGDLQKNSTMSIELELLLLLQRRGLLIERERDFNISRSGSAPPTVEGAWSAAGSLHWNPNFALLESDGSDSNGALMREEEIRSHPAYLAYYYSKENSNPRLPPSLLSRDDWRVSPRIQGGRSAMGVNGKWRSSHLVNDNGSSSLFSMQPKIPIQKSDTQPTELRKTAVKNLSRKNSTESVAAPGLPQKSEMVVRRKSFADIVQEGRGQSSSFSGQFLRPSSHNSFPKVLDTADIVNTSCIDSQEKEESSEALYFPQLGSGFYEGLALTNSFSAAGSSSIKISPSEPHQTLRSPPGFPVVCSPDSVDGHVNIAHSNSPDPSSGKTQISDILTSFPGLSLSKDQVNQSTLLQSAIETGLPNAHIQNMQQQFNESRADKNGSSHIGFTREIGVAPDVNYINFDRQVNLPRRTSSSVNLRSLANPSDFSVLQGPKIKYQGSHPTGYILNGQSQKSGSYGCSNLHSPDAQHDEVLEQSTSYVSQEAATLRNLSQGINNISTSHDLVDLLDLERMYFKALLGQQKKQFPFSYQYNGNPTVGICMAHQGNPLVNSIYSAIRPEHQCQNKQSSHFHTFKVQVGESFGSCKTAGGTTAEAKSSSSLLEELKNNKSKSLELLDVLDQVVEFSMDQYGSRFIQQKLEIATIEDKMKIFPQILPHVQALMTDVFGNYVIQKFFEHGTEGQRKELSSQLLGHVLPLSLQMYGCRVIQKALEVVDVEQQIQIITELNGSVMKCVHDQNGNHVIQKCIECVPQDRIEFIISSFFGQVVALSTHPFGCRVIQRVLEHCDDPNTQQIIMGEIMKSVCILAQHQFGNYVIQLVLQHGKPHEKAEIVDKVAGQVVKMSQQKFASNVVEKCLTFCGPEERKILINEMLGSMDENEGLQAMMKDPFGNYVVQKVLETCDNQSRELIISRIKVHLNALKRYTYGKHIVSRIEKLIEAGEKDREVKT